MLLLKNCVSATRAAVIQIEQLTKTLKGRNELSQKFNACALISQDDVPYFKWIISEWLASSAQWQNPPAWQMTAYCNMLTATNDYVSNWGNAMVVTSGGVCNAFTLESIVSPLQDISLGNADRSWFFQKCTEFAYFQVSYPGTSIFFDNMPSTMQESWCRMAFGKPLIPNVDWTNTYYGGMNVAGTNIMFTNGLMDPWHTLSLVGTNNTQQYVVNYEAAHCAPMTQPTSEDPRSLIHARIQIVEFLQGILMNYNK